MLIELVKKIFMVKGVPFRQSYESERFLAKSPCGSLFEPRRNVVAASSSRLQKMRSECLWGMSHKYFLDKVFL